MKRMNNMQVKASQISRRELFQRVLSKSMTTNATELDTTTASLATLVRGCYEPAAMATTCFIMRQAKATT